ncbi:vomeronasal type-1 receptor 4-like [Gracilinanus agilis]|uniref:vomeronasal type-1 receptor 4-like n=1 Tax=Gracilinanus agilis TaxID=191870 RepID=UPI001CFE6F70|nr:vomeronasal type-1 receptor 4-like [Gracilinanus agilis]
MILSVAFFTQTGIGVIGNSFLICLFVFLFLSGCRLRPIDLIFTQLVLGNCLTILSKGIPRTMVAFGMNNFLDITGCKIIIYLQRVARGLTLTLTCLLSGFQAIAISPRNTGPAGLKDRAQKRIVPSFLLCWAFHGLLNIFIPVGMIDPRHIINTTQIQHYGYCSHLVPSRFWASLYTFLLSFPDAVSLGFMIFANGYMVLLLYRHHRQVEQIRITCLSTPAFPEIKATKTILLLVSTFVSSYSVECILSAFMAFMKSPTWFVHTSAFMTSFYPAISPYVLMSSDSHILKHCSVLCGRKVPHFYKESRRLSPVMGDPRKAPVKGKALGRW